MHETEDKQALALGVTRDLRGAGRPSSLAARVIRDLAPRHGVVGIYSGSVTDCEALEKMLLTSPLHESLVRLGSLAECNEALSHRSLDVLLTLGWGSTAAIEAAARHGATSVLIQLGSGGGLEDRVRAWEAGVTLTHQVDRGEPEWAAHLSHTLEVAVAHARRHEQDKRERLVLWAEDEDGVREMVSELLPRFPGSPRVLGARNGREAIRALDEHEDRIDVIVSDLGMPDIDGREFFTTIAARVRGHIPLVIEETGFQLDAWSDMPRATLAAVHGRVSIGPVWGSITNAVFERLFAIRDAMRAASR